MMIALDAMGGDFAPMHEVQGALLALQQDSTLSILLVGQEDRLRQELGKNLDTYSGRLMIRHASEIVTMNDSPVAVVKEKKDASINVAVRAVKHGEADVVVSAGNTGAVMTASLFGFGRIKGIDRPPIVGIFPSYKKPFAILDIGANVDCKPHHLVQFAHLGSIYAEKILHYSKPRVALVNIGEEPEKGNEQTIVTHALLKKEPLNFVGNVEGKHLLDGDIDVAVCDGFLGNMILKFGESAVKLLMTEIKQGIKSSLLSRLGGLMIVPSLVPLKKKIDVEEKGGALLMGLNKTVIITHGSASAHAIKNALFAARDAVQSGMVEHIKKTMEQLY